MSRILLMNLRAKPRIDYKLLHKTGEKVFKKFDGNNQKMEDENLKEKFERKFNLKEEEVLNELTIFGDIKHCWGIYDIEEWDTEDEINEGIKCVSDLSLEYRHIHVVLKRKLGDNYNEKYPDYDKNVHSLTMFTMRNTLTMVMCIV